MPNIKNKSIVKLKDRGIWEYIHDSLMRDGRVKITGHGVLWLKRLPARKGFNVGNGSRESFPSYVKINFTPTKNLKERAQKWKK